MLSNAKVKESNYDQIILKISLKNYIICYKRMFDPLIMKIIKKKDKEYEILRFLFLQWLSFK